MIVIDAFIDKTWQKQYLKKHEMKQIINQCLKVTNIKKKTVFLNVNFTNSKTIKQYNKQYRDNDNVTNVLSFENKDQNNGDILILGDMVLCFEKIQDEAMKFNKPFKERLYHLFVHSILHLLGYDHIIKTERIKMEKLEEKILRTFNIYNPYLLN